MDSFVSIVEQSALSQFLRANPWFWPTSEILHFIGLALLVGVIGTFDLRMLGVGKRVDIDSLHALIPWGVFGFAVNLITGTLFFVCLPRAYIGNPVFLAKIGFIALAGANVLLFYVTGVFRRVKELKPGEDAPPPAKLIAASSLVLWIVVMFCGRLMPFFAE